MQKKITSKGFFLIEIIIAVTVFALGSMLIMNALVQGFKEMQNAMYRLEATTLTINYIEQWRVYDNYQGQSYQHYSIEASTKKIDHSLRMVEIVVKPKESYEHSDKQEIFFVAYKNE